MVPLFKRKPQELLTDLQAVNNIEELEKVLIGRKKPLSGLRNAIALFEQQEQLNFMETILPALQTFLREPHSLTTLPLLQAQTNSSVQLSHKEMRFILTNAFLLNIKNMPQDGYGFFDFGLLMIREDKIGQERLKCMLAYFQRELNSDDTKIHKPISIERFCEEPFDFPDWKTCGELIHPENVVVHTGRIEDVVGTWDIHSEGSGDSRITIVDFANMQIHIGHIMASTTQEEVLFSCSPECFLCLLLCEQMLPQEVVLVRNVRRSVEYRGFLRTFQQTGTIMDAAPMDVLALDASCRDSFRPVTIIRDLNKAWVGFKNSTDVISTGHWGCGAFGGDKLFKFIQQICAASLAGKKLQYSTYNEEDTAQQFKTVLSKLVEKSKTIGDIVKFLLEYGASPATNFTEYVSAWLE